MKLTVQPIKDSPYFDVVDVDPPNAPGTRVIRAAHCTKAEAELFASAPMMKMQLAFITALGLWKMQVGWIGQFFDWVTRGWYARVILDCPRPTFERVAADVHRTILQKEA